MEHTYITGSIVDKPLASNSVNLIMTSPPYAQQRKNTYGGVKPDDYVDWFMQFSDVFQDALAEDGSMIINIKENVVDGQRHTYVYELVMALQQQGWRWVDEYIWHKTTSVPGKWPNRFRDQWERLYHFTLNKKFTMNQEDVMVPVGDWAKTRLKSMSESDKARRNSQTQSGFGSNLSNWSDRKMVYPSNVLSGSPVAHNVGHPAAYPQWLPEWFITLFSDPDDTVLDPFSGSGTTSLAAEKLGRNSINYDLVEDYNRLAMDTMTKRHPDSIIHIDTL